MSGGGLRRIAIEAGDGLSHGIERGPSLASAAAERRCAATTVSDRGICGVDGNVRSGYCETVTNAVRVHQTARRSRGPKKAPAWSRCSQRRFINVQALDRNANHRIAASERPPRLLI